MLTCQKKFLNLISSNSLIPVALYNKLLADTPQSPSVPTAILLNAMLIALLLGIVERTFLP